MHEQATQYITHTNHSSKAGVDACFRQLQQVRRARYFNLAVMRLNQLDA